MQGVKQGWQMVQQRRQIVYQRWLGGQRLGQPLPGVVLMRGRSRQTVNEPFQLCAVPFLACLPLQRDLMSRLPASHLKLYD